MMPTVIEILALVACGFWSLLLLDLRRRWSRRLFLGPEADLSQELSQVTAVVPARDEASLLPVTLASLLAQEAPGWRVFVVDDHSQDDTAGAALETAQRMAAHEVLHVVHAPERPPGWTGKLHALAEGITKAGSSAEWLLLTDADIYHPPGTLRRLLAKATEGPYDLVSVMARLHAQSFWERLLIPPFVFFFQLLYPFCLVARPQSRVAAAAGGCILVRRESLEAAGGLAAVRGQVIDDVALATAVKRSGARLWLGLDPGISSVRPYRSLAELWQMVARSAFVQLRYRWDLLALAVLGLLTLVAAPPLLLCFAAGGLLLEPGTAAHATAPLILASLASLAAWALQTGAVYPYVRHHQVPALFAATLPLAAAFYALMTLTSALNHLMGQGSRWKGRSYP